MSKILIVDDEPDIRSVLRTALKPQGYEVVEAQDGKEALAIIEQDLPDVVLLDLMMPKMDGLELCERVRSDFKNATTYIIMLTARSQNHEKVTGLNLGADVYFTKPFDPGVLLAQIKVGVKTAEDRGRAMADPLTRLFNRHIFDTFVILEAERAKRYKHPMSVILIDIDHFKKVNDSYGHPAGDAVLVQLACILRQHSRKSDLPCRYGGEEFILLLPETALAGAKKTAEGIRAAVESHAFPEVGKLTASFGVSNLSEGVKSMIELADQALYKAKERGRNQVVAFPESI